MYIYNMINSWESMREALEKTPWVSRAPNALQELLCIIDI
jgi:hypothetical protein